MICTKFFSPILNFFYSNFERKQSLLYEKGQAMIAKVLHYKFFGVVN